MSTSNFNQLSDRLSDEEAADGICFVSEQDGLPERELKRELAGLFSGEIGVRRAYLARIVYQGRTVQRVALCIRAGAGMESDIATSVGKIFTRLFSRDVSMDIVFMNKLSEDRLAAVCEPFFSIPATE